MEELIAAQFRLDGEDVIRVSTGLPIRNKPDALGYVRLRVATGKRGGKSLWLHRVKFFLIHGYLPPMVDHKSRAPEDNTGANLRAATRQQNMLNRRQPSRRTLPRGVYKSQRGKGYYAACSFNKVRHHLGYHQTVEQATAAVETFRRKHHGEFYAEAQGS